VERNDGWWREPFSKKAAQREEEEELRASRLFGFSTDVAFIYFLFHFHFYSVVL
jgi:hypothetical protein